MAPPPPPAAPPAPPPPAASTRRERAQKAAERRRAAQAAERRKKKAAAREAAAKRKAAAKQKAAAAAAAAALPPRDGNPPLPGATRPVPERIASTPVVVRSPPAVSPLAVRVFLVFGAIALVCLAAAAAPARILRTVSGGLVWRRGDLAFAALVLLSVGLLAVIAGAM